MSRPSRLTLFCARRRWTVDDAKVVLGALDASWLSATEFADRERIDAQRLRRWRSVLDRRAAPAPAFVELAGRGGDDRLEVVLRSGHVVRVPDSFDAATLRRIVDVFESDAPC